MRALDDLNVLSLAQIYNGPYCALMLSYLGADVVKIEPPGGENIRSRDEDGLTPEVIMLNSSKESITIDLKQDRGKELLKSLVTEADILIENYATGTMDRLGLGYETLSDINPELIYAHSSGYGEEGPYTDYPAMDLTIQAMGGVMDVTGFPDQQPVKAGVQVADFLGGIHLFGGILAAVHQRDRTGEGQFVEVGMLDAIYPTLLSPMAAHYRVPEAPPRTGNRHSGLAICPYNVYEAHDGYIAIICVNERHWKRLANIIDPETLLNTPKYETNEKRKERMDELDQIIQDWTKTKSRESLADALLSEGVPCAPVQKRDEVLFDHHLEARGMVHEIEHPGFGRIRVPGSPIRLHNSNDPEITPAHIAGQANEEVLTRHGLSKEEIAELVDEEII